MNDTKKFNGKVIYNPSGKAQEYSYWAANFYVGCSAMCHYCYNRHGITAKVLGADKPTLKKCLINEDTAMKIFIKEVDKNLDALRQHGLFFNFVSDPCLPETWDLNREAITYCIIFGIPCKVLTKQTWWLEPFLYWFEKSERIWNHKGLLAFGFTLTGHDELEPGAAPNIDRVRAMKVLYDEGFKTFASIEPIIEVGTSVKMINEIANHTDLIKVGLQSGKRYQKFELMHMYNSVCSSAEVFGYKVYFKDSFVQQLGIKREDMPECCVTRDYNLFANN